MTQFIAVELDSDSLSINDCAIIFVRFGAGAKRDALFPNTDTVLAAFWLNVITRFQSVST